MPKVSVEVEESIIFQTNNLSVITSSDDGQPYEKFHEDKRKMEEEKRMEF